MHQSPHGAQVSDGAEPRGVDLSDPIDKYLFRDVHYDARDPADLAVLIENGLIWKGGPKTVALAVDALVRGRVPYNDRIPEIVLAHVNQRRADAGEVQLGPDAGWQSPSVPVSTDPIEPVGWVCPEHGADYIVTLHARGGTTLRACDRADCDRIEGDDEVAPEATETCSICGAAYVRSLWPTHLAGTLHSRAVAQQNAPPPKPVQQEGFADGALHLLGIVVLIGLAWWFFTTFPGLFENLACARNGC